MSATRPPELDDLYTRIAVTPREAGQVPLLGRAILIAEEAGDEDALYELRCCLAQSATRAADAETEIAAFSWALERHLSDPTRFPLVVRSPDYVDLAWLFKWILDTLMKNSAIGRDQIESSLAAMEDLYRREGLGLSAPAQCRLAAAEYLGDVDDLEELAARFEATPRDAHSDCEVCTPRWLATAELMLARPERAIDRGRAVLASGRTCLSEPQGLLADLLIPLLQDGQLETAEEYFQRCRDKVWTSGYERMAATGELLAASAVTGNLALGLDLLEHRLSDLASVVHDHRNRLGFLSGAALLLDRVERAGLGERPVRDTVGVLAAQSLAPSGANVAVLAEALWAESDRLAAAFDARAGNRWWRGWLDARRALGDLDVPLDLGYAEAAPLLVPSRPDPTTARDWLNRARERSWIGDTVGAVAAAGRAIEIGGLSGDDLAGALRTRERGLSRAVQEAAGVTSLADVPEADLTLLRAATAEYRAELERQGRLDRIRVIDALGPERDDLGWAPDADHLVALVEELRSAGIADDELDGIEFEAARSFARAGRGEEAAQLALAAREHSLATARPDEVAAYQLSVGELLAWLGHPDAHAALSAAVGQPDAEPVLHALALRALARLHGQAGEWSEGITAAREAVHLLSGLEVPAVAAEASELHAALLESSGDLAGSVRAARRALDLAEPQEGLDTSALRLELGRRLVVAGRPGEAVAVLRDVDRALLERSEPEGSPDAYGCAFWLGTALRDAGDANRAADVWDAAFGVAVSRGDHGVQVTLGRDLGNLFAAYSVWEEALRVFRATRDAEAALNDGTAPEFDERVGLIRCLAGDAGGLDDLDAALEAARAVGADLAVADWTDSRARALQALDRTEEAVAASLQASDLFTTAGRPDGWAMALGYAARLLADQGRRAEALALLDPVLTDSEDPILAGLRALRDELGGTD